MKTDRFIASGLFVSALAVLFLACTAETPEAIPNLCLVPNVREVRVSPRLDADWQDAIRWAFDRWKEVVPGLLFHIVVTDAASKSSVPCVTSFVAEDLKVPGLYGVTANGYVLLSSGNTLSVTGKRSVTLHELGHLLFGFADSKDPTSIMHLPLNLPVIQDQDAAMAREAFLQRDGAGLNPASSPLARKEPTT